MRIGILGSGLMGAKLGTIFARAGHEVTFSYSRDQQKLDRLARDGGNGARSGTPGDATRDADALLLAVHWSRVDDVLRQAGDLSGKAVVTCSLPMSADDSTLVVAHTSSGAEELLKKIPSARVVSAFNTVPSEVLFSVFETRDGDERPSMVYCGDDSAAKNVAAQLITDAGFNPVDAGPLRMLATPNPSRCSWHSSRTSVRADRLSRIASSGSTSSMTLRGRTRQGRSDLPPSQGGVYRRGPLPRFAVRHQSFTSERN